MKGIAESDSYLALVGRVPVLEVRENPADSLAGNIFVLCALSDHSVRIWASSDEENLVGWIKCGVRR